MFRVLLLGTLLTITNGATLTSLLSPCSCLYKGGFYNLRPLGSKHGPALEAHVPNDYEYGYNPCIPFTMGDCKDVAICHWDDQYQSYITLGLQTGVKCQGIIYKGTPIVRLIYKQQGKEREGMLTYVHMKCNRTKEKAEFTVLEDTAWPILQVEHKCCCPDVCPDLTPLPTPSPTKRTGEIIGGVVGGLFIVAVVIYGIYRTKQRPDNNHNQAPRYGAIGDGDVGANRDDVGAGADAEGGGGDDADRDDVGGGDVGANRDDVGAGADAEGGGGDAGGGGGDDADRDDVGGGDVGADRDDIRGGADADRDDVGGGGDVGADRDDAVHDDDNLSNNRSRVGSPHILNFIPDVPDDQLSRAVEEQNPEIPPPDGEHERSPSVPIPVSQDPEDQCCDDERALLPAPSPDPVENSCELS